MLFGHELVNAHRQIRNFIGKSALVHLAIGTGQDIGNVALRRSHRQVAGELDERNNAEIERLVRLGLDVLLVVLIAVEMNKDGPETRFDIGENRGSGFVHIPYGHIRSGRLAIDLDGDSRGVLLLQLFFLPLFLLGLVRGQRLFRDDTLLDRRPARAPAPDEPEEDIAPPRPAGRRRWRSSA